jgi:hypothetical protein
VRSEEWGGLPERAEGAATHSATRAAADFFTGSEKFTSSLLILPPFTAVLSPAEDTRMPDGRQLTSMLAKN